MKTADFDYDLPEALIAQTPAARREDARLLVVHRAERRLEHRRFFELPEFLHAGDCLIRNTARVRPARLFARRAGGGRVECLLLRPAGPGSEPEVDPNAILSTAPTHRALCSTADPARAEEWWCLLRPGRRLPVGTTFGVAGEFTAEVREKSAAAEYRVAFHSARGGESVAAIAERLGRVPLPPYIHRRDPEVAIGDVAPDSDVNALPDRARYQTVFADREHTVAVAAPTAGLHFSEALLAQLAAIGVTYADVVLHVGLGTFRPIETEDVSAHPIHRERIEIPAATRRLLAANVSGRRIAVGTTSVRTVEHYARTLGRGEGGGGDGDYEDEADLFLHPPARFEFVDGLITNFHLPRSTLLCLVAAFLTPGTTEGVSWLREIYAEAMRERYRFLSYGDAMLIV